VVELVYTHDLKSCLERDEGSIPSPGTVNKYILEITAFVSGGVVMTLELVGSRVFAPYLGASTFIWTSLIGVILASLSIGYWWGGKLADRNPSVSLLSSILFIASVPIAITSIIQPLLGVVYTMFDDIRLAAVAGGILLFSPATIALGTVTPLVVRLKMRDVATSGATVGRLYALSTIGSIIGTFLGGFFLISYFGTTRILLTLSCTLILLSLLLYVFTGNKFPTRRITLFSLILLAHIFPPAPALGLSTSIVKDIDTHYSRLWISDETDRITGRPVRYLTNSKSFLQSGMFLDNPTELLFEYTKRYDLAAHFAPNFKTALMIGAGGYSYPKHFLETYPEATLDVVEIDPALADIAKKFFFLKDDPRLTIYNEDGRLFLNRSTKKYDAVLIDAFSPSSVPHHLTTLETVQHIEKILTDKGVVIVNIISALEGEKSQFLQAQYVTYKEVFPQVYVFKTSNNRQTTTLQNIMLVALKDSHLPSFASDNEPLSAYLQQLWKSDHLFFNLPILTDDFAPVEKYLDKAFRN
jgi:spermidine synthase